MDKGAVVFIKDRYLTGEVITIVGDKALVLSRMLTDWYALDQLIKIK